MITTNKETCNILVDLLVTAGIKNVVVSPGSRNAPLLIAVARCKALQKYIVVDERSAAFMALGMVQQSGDPVALICTSGTALLNYAPAVAEAYYQKMPLILISADRPSEWIDQDDSQTLRQYEALSSFVKKSYNISAECNSDTQRWYVNRVINDAIIEALTPAQSPVHINIAIDEPLCDVNEYNGTSRFIKSIKSVDVIDTDVISQLAQQLSTSPRVMIVAGYMQPDDALSEALKPLVKLPNVLLLTENISNIHVPGAINTIDRVLSVMEEQDSEAMRPDLVITIGGALISRMVKKYLRKYKADSHWYVGRTYNTIDCLQSLTHRIDVNPVSFFSQICEHIQSPCDSEYANKWKTLETIATKSHNDYVAASPWCNLKAFAYMLPNIPKQWNIQLSNGTTIRYAQLFDNANDNRCDCNRGVSGIDGCTSTALGASLTYNGNTILFTGDMSFSYDLNGITNAYRHKNFKIVVLCNGGGGIFRFINGPRDLVELEDYFAVKRNIPIDKLASAYGWHYYQANDEMQLKSVFHEFLSDAHASILAVYTPENVNAEILRHYFSRTKNK